MDSFIILSQCSFFTPPFRALFLRRSTQSVKPSWLAAILFLNSVITAGESIPFAPNTIRALVIAPQVPPHFIPPPKLQPIAAACCSVIHRRRLSLLSGHSCLPLGFHFLTALLYLYVYSLIVLQLHFRIFSKYFLNLHIYAFRKCS